MMELCSLLGTVRITDIECVDRLDNGLLLTMCVTMCQLKDNV